MNNHSLHFSENFILCKGITSICYNNCVAKVPELINKLKYN